MYFTMCICTFGKEKLKYPEVSWRKHGPTGEPRETCNAHDLMFSSSSVSEEAGCLRLSVQFACQLRVEWLRQVGCHSDA